MDTIYNQFKETLCSVNSINDVPLFLQKIKQIHSLKVITDDSLTLIASNEINNTLKPTTSSDNSVEWITRIFCNFYKNVIIDNSTGLPIFLQPNFYLNDNSRYLLENQTLSNAKITKAYFGTVVTVFFHKKWYITTKRCLNTGNETINDSTTVKSLFDNAVQTLFSYDELDKELIYQFVLVNTDVLKTKDNDGTNIKVLHTDTFKKGSFIPINNIINQKVKVPETFIFSNVLELTNTLEQLDVNNDFISTTGFIVKIITDNSYSVHYIQTKTMEVLSKYICHNNNYKIMLHLYQNKLLNKYGKFVQYCNYTLVHASFYSVAKELTYIYHKTRNHQNSHIYNKLPTSYKIFLFDLHRVYLESKRMSNNNKITVSDTLKLMHEITYEQLEKIYFDRDKLFLFTSNFMNLNCVNTFEFIKLISNN